ncbi:polymerase [Langya virus]|uniref:RNA-directed RNA polymerase L n=1 Tax=Langya virus TaxID=2971765 RepID=A0AAX3C928_9MONO|nr:polymerase [Langya virus]UUV47214.1 polymerase [Langya virus]UUV47221.1 polymerase [Langya virus]
MNFSDVSISDILYPECHLNSPIVTGKIVQAVRFSEIPCNQILIDPTLNDVIDIKLRSNKQGLIRRRQKEYGLLLKQVAGDITSYQHIPYPECNTRLFYIHDPSLVDCLTEIMTHANQCYLKISSRILDLLDKTECSLTGIGSRDDDETRIIYNNIETLPKIMAQSRWYKSFLFWFTVKTEMRNNIKENKKYSKHNRPHITQLSGKQLYVQINMNLISIIEWDKKCIYHLTPELVLMYCDVLEGRLMIDTVMQADTRYHPLCERAHQLWELLDLMFEELGNNMYNLISMIEPLTLGILQLQDKAVALVGSFLSFCINEIKEELIKNGFNDEQDINEFTSRIINIMSIPDIHLVAEFFSFFRTFGHPTLEALTAAEKVRTHMQKPKILEFLPIMKAHAIFCGIIINGYRDRHGGAWPPVVFPEHASVLIKRLHNSSEALTHEICCQEWKSFCGFKFKCFLPLELDSDLSMYMKDKALSPIKDEWDSVYPSESMCYSPPNSTTSRRLVDVFVNDADFDPYEIIDYVLSGKYKTDPEFNISYSLKEKETKQAGRLFAKMTYKMRACQVVAESLIANGIGKYFKENGMVKDEHELLKSLHQLSASSVPKNEGFNEDNWKIDKKPFRKIEGRDCLSKENKTLLNSKVITNTIGQNHFNTSLQNKQPRTPKSRSARNKNKYSLQNAISDYITRDYTLQDHTNTAVDKSEEKYDTISSFLTTDLQKFCLNWRYESTALFAERVDEIYGLPGFFNWLHNRLENCTLYVADPYCPPPFTAHIDLDDVPDEGMFIRHPMGGIEGYSQKLWTIITIPFLFLSGVETNTRVAAVVQGDNQSIAITHRVHPNMSYIAKKNVSAEKAKIYFERLRSNLDALGHNLKLTETIISTHFFVYSKRIYYDGMVLSQGLKSVSRCVFWSETLVDETRSACSNISTSIAKAIENGMSKDVGYSLNILKTIQQIVVSLKFSINETMTPDVTNPLIQNVNWLLTACLMPASLGGFNYLNLSRLYVRNIGDPITASLADLKRMISSGLMTERVLHQIMTQAPGDATFLDWASDPYSANLPSSQSITKTIKNVTARLVLANAKNPILKGLFHTTYHDEDRCLAEFLMDRSIIMPRAAHEILDNSITGAREEISGMLDTTKGLIRTGLSKGGIQPRLVSKLSHYDYEQFRVFNNLMRNKNMSPYIKPTICSVELAKYLRAHMWRRLSQGRLIYGLEVPDPIESMQGSIIRGSEECSICTSERSPYCWFFIPKGMDLDRVHRPTNSIRVPYIGSSTDERSEIKLGHVKSSSRALKSAIRIATVYTWAFGDDDESWLEAWYLASQRVNIDLEVLKAITPISTSNNLAHRLRDRATQVKFNGSSLNRVSRYVTISNDRLEFIINDQKVDTNLIFQQVMLLGLSAIEQRYRYRVQTGDENVIYHLHAKEHCCIIEMSSTGNVPSLIEPPIYKEIKENRLIYDDNPIIDKDLKKLRTQAWYSSDVDFSNWKSSDLHCVLAQSLAHTIIESISKSDNDILKQFVTISSDDNINSLITEFLLVDVNLLSIYLGQACSNKWAFDIHFKRPQGKWQMIELLTDLLSETSVHVFRVLTNALSHPRVFKKFWDSGLLSPYYGPYFYNQDVTKLAIDLIISSYTMYLTVWLEGRTVNFLMAEQSVDAIEIRTQTIQAKHLCMLCDLYCNEQGPPHIRDLLPHQKIDILSDFIRKTRLNIVGSDAWNVHNLHINVYPASLTYLRRGVIKQLRIRQDIGEMFDIIEMDRKYHKYMVETAINYKPRSTCTVLNLSDIDRPLNSTLYIDLEDSVPVNGWESHKYRRVGINSTSGYKALELYSIIERFYTPGSARLFVGEGSGAMMSVYFKLLGKSVNYYNSGISELDVVGQRELRLYPAEACIVDHNLGEEYGLLKSIVPLFNGRPETTWIGNMDCFIHIMRMIKSHSLGLLHSDMESGVDKDNLIILNEHSHLLSLAVNLLRFDGILVSKINPSSSFPLTALFNMYKACFVDIKIALPKYSNPNSTECYLICTQPRILTVVTPEIILEHSVDKPEDCNKSVLNYILILKFRIGISFEDRGRSVIDDETEASFANSVNEYNRARLPHRPPHPRNFYRQGNAENLTLINLVSGLTEDDKVLLSCGLSLNGPTVCQKLLGYDTGSPLGTILESSFLLLNEALNIYDGNRMPSSFFEPYPILESTRLSKYMHKFIRKIIGYTYLKYDSLDLSLVDRHISNLKRRYLIFDFSDYKHTKIIPNYYYKRIKKGKFKQSWMISLATKEIKLWWKLISYVPVFRKIV